MFGDLIVGRAYEHNFYLHVIMFMTKAKEDTKKTNHSLHKQVLYNICSCNIK